MAEMTFYKQVRQDDGVRVGLTIDGVHRFMDFRPGPGEPDPALNWYLDVRCAGPNVPEDPEQARQWLLDNGPAVKETLNRLADELRAGMDADIYPLSRPVPNPPAGATVRIVCSAVRRTTALDIADRLRETAGEWDSLLRGLTRFDGPGA